MYIVAKIHFLAKREVLYLLQRAGIWKCRVG